MAERQKAKYRVVVLGLLAAFGPPAFGFRVGLLVALYSALLVAYALWALRLTVVFPNDSSLGYLLCLFDAALVMPLVVWGASPWLFVPLVLLWCAGLISSIRTATSESGAERQQRVAAAGTAALEADSTGYLPRAAFGDDLRGLYLQRAEAFGILVVRLQRYQEIRVLLGQESAGQALGALSRRVQREAGGDMRGYHITNDRIAFILAGEGLQEAGPIAARARRAANSRLVNGQKMEALVGYAAYPVDGLSPKDLLLAADRRAGEAGMSVPVRPPAAAGARLAAL